MDCEHIWETRYWWDEPPTTTCVRCRVAREDWEHDKNLPPHTADMIDQEALRPAERAPTGR